MSQDGYDIGVLYLPGIDPRASGEDLRRLVDVVALWLDDWLSEGRSAGFHTGLPHEVTWSRTCLTPEEEQPAHVVLSVPAGPEGAPVSLVIATSAWRDALGEPTRQALASWLIRLLPMLVIEYFHGMLFRASATGRTHRGMWLSRVVVALLTFLVAVPVAALLAPLLLLVAVVSRLPLPGVGALAGAIETRLARLFGHSLVLSESGTRFLSAVDVTGTNLDWLAGRCRRVVVLGFAQGAVIGHEVVRRRTPTNLALLVTVGSALRTFYEMPFLATGRSPAWRTLGNILGALPFIGIYCVVIPVAVIASFATEFNVRNVFTGLGALLPVALYGSVGLSLLFDATRAGRPLSAAAQLRLPGAGELFTWLDYASTADPVPQGALVEGADAARFGGWPVSVAVSNEAALWRDHSLYWANRDEFLTHLIVTIFGVADIDVRQPGDADLIARAARRRAYRVAALGRMRLLVAAAGICLGVRLLETWTQLGIDVLRATPRPIEQLIGKMLEPFAPLYPGPHWANRLFGLLILTLLCVVLIRVLRFLWLRWQAHEVQRLFARQTNDTGGLARVAFSLLTALVGLTIVWTVSGDIVPTPNRILVDFFISPLRRLPDLVVFVAIFGACGGWLIRRPPGRGTVRAFLWFIGFVCLTVAILTPFHFRRWAVDVNLPVLLASSVGIAFGVGMACLSIRPIGRLVAFTKARLARVPESATPQAGQNADGAVEIARLWHGDQINALAVASNGQLLSGSTDTTACLWSSNFVGEPARFYHGKKVTAVTINADGSVLVTGGRGKAIAHDAATGRRLALFSPYGEVNCVAVDPNGDGLLIGGEDGAGRWPWHGNSFEPLTEAVTRAARYVPGGLWLSTSHVLWFLPGTEPRQKVFEVVGVRDEIWRASFADDGRTYVALHSGQATAGRRDRPAWRVEMQKRLSDKVVAIDPTGRLVAIGDSKGIVRILSLATTAEVAQMRHLRPVSAVTFDNSGTEVFTGTSNGVISVWRLTTAAATANDSAAA